MFKKCKVVMLPSDKPTFISKGKMIPSIFYCPNNEVYDEDAEECQHLYIISDDEIKVGDWVLWMGILPNEFQITRVDKIDSTFERQRDECRKIIATTDPFLSKEECIECSGWGNDQKGYCSKCKGSGNGKIFPRPTDSFIKEYCELSGIEEIKVEYYEDDFGEVYESNELGIDWGSGIDVSGKLKIASDNTITIEKLKSSFTKEDMYKAYMAGRDHEYETRQFVPNGKDKAQYAIVDESFNKWVNEKF